MFAFKWIQFTHWLRPITTVHVDFDRHWARVIWDFRFLQLGMIVAELFINLSWILIPLGIAYGFSVQNSMIIIGVIVGKLIADTIGYSIGFICNPRLQIGVIESVFLSATKQIMQSDPVHTSMRESGKILSKTEAGSDAYETLLDIIQFDFLNYALGLIVIFTTLAPISVLVSALVSLATICIMILNVVINIYIERTLRPTVIRHRDQEKQIIHENLQQTRYIRAQFATSTQFAKHQDKNYIKRNIRGAIWNAQGVAFQIPVFVYFIVVLFLSLYLFSQVNQGALDASLAAGIIATYFLSTDEILSIGNTAKKFTRAYTEITDLFTFMQGYGEATFPSIKT